MEAVRARRIAGAVALIAGLQALPACSASVAGPSLVLTLASPGDRAQRGSADAVKRFVEEVDRRSNGTVRIEPEWEPVPRTTHEWDQLTAQLVLDGDADLALIPGRAFDVLGVATLRPLNAPFMVTSPAALRSVLESPIREDLLAGLPDAGFAGLDLFPDLQRHPFGFGKPLLGADDYQGQEIRTPTSATVAEMFGALGATVDDLALNAANQRGIEANFDIAGGDVATGNVTFFMKTNALVASTTLRDGLRPDQWTLLREAAAATRDWLYDALPSDLDLAVGFCDHHGTIVGATPEQVQGLRDATAPVVERMREDPDLGAIVDAIAQEVRDVPEPAPVTDCPGSPPPGSLGKLDGRYHSVVTKKTLVAAGVTNPNQISMNTGRFTWILDGGRWTYHQRVGHYATNLNDTGSYEYDDGVFTLNWGAPGDFSRMHVRVDRNGDLHFTDVYEGMPDNQALGEGFFAMPWHRVGDAPD
jgi:TRAP-type C4-dicarboxylate transport system substrate-binding protein